ncbi:MAG: flippase-like domain-containing protein [Anaerolineales bacterium]|nr:flippase-like domain-containing protein [Anaerolineales bacterium]
MKKFIVSLIFFLGITLIILSFSELKETVQILQGGNFWFVGLAFGVEFIWVFFTGLTYRSIYKLLDMKESGWHLMLVAVAANFVNNVTPAAGMGGTALYIQNGVRRGHPPGKVTAASALYVLLDFSSFLCVLALGLVVLIRRNDIQIGEVIASLILLTITSTLAFLMILGIHSSQDLGRVLAWAARGINHIVRPIIKREYLSKERAHEFAAEIADGLTALRVNRQNLFKPLVFALIGKGLLISILTLIFLGFSIPFSSGTIVGGFSIGYLFMIVSPTPSGVGFMEGALVLALTSLRVKYSNAVVVMLVYRAITFWMPIGLGAPAFRYLQK